MRPLVVSHTGVTGGSTQGILGLLRNRPADVDPVCAFLDDGPAARAVRDLGVEAHVLNAGRARELWRVPAVVARLARLMRSHHVDVVFSHASKAQVYAAPAAAIARVPNLWHQYEVPGLERSAPGMTRVLQELAGRLPTRMVLCGSEFVARRHAARWPGAPVRRVYPGVRADGVAPREHTAASDVRIVVTGRLQRWKRVDRALDAMPRLLEAVPGARLRIVGAGRPDVDADYPAELRARAAALGITGAVEFAGEPADVDAQLAGADILVHPADREGFGLAVAEALLRGIPAVVAPLGGPTEIVRDGVDGLIVDPEDAPALAGALVRLARDPGTRSEMGRAGRARVLELFDEGRAAAETWRLVAEATARPRARRSHTAVGKPASRAYVGGE
ncbi:MAG TPA: glycosyltransferase family 4 protein [Baekduia sp.]|nr:glycosyltransferase family 4 protein [Baekduia sp.]